LRAKYLFEWFPPIIEEEIDEVKAQNLLNEIEKEMLRTELGENLFGELYNPHGAGNPNMLSRIAGIFGSKVKEIGIEISKVKKSH
jgi:hypothetical protein